MNTFVTGLCLQGNKGGPAITLSLMRQLRKYVPGMEFTFSVPGKEPFFQLEQKWAQIYGVSVVKHLSLKEVLPPWSWRRQERQRRHTWLEALNHADLLLEMSAISYVGPPARTYRYSLEDFIYFWLSRRSGKPFLRWTMSYGPFSSWLVSTLARIDLSSQPIILCRGEGTKDAVNRLLPQKQALSFPDVATVLSYSREWGQGFLAKKFGLGQEDALVTVSPSAVIYSADLAQGRKTHVTDLAQFCDYLLESGYRVLFVPHALRVVHRDPRSDDLGVALEVQSSMKHGSRAALLEDDLSAIELKSIISNAFIHVGARYHSVVAALSSGVPCISLAWHHKYTDIMKMYNLDKYVFVSQPGKGISPLIEMFSGLAADRENISNRLSRTQPEIESQVDENTRVFLDMMRTVIK
jgi:polysaccharide pyruvyl transferase WcaK-like protein